MKVIVKEPGKTPEMREIENTLKALQEIVGGYIETFTLDEDTVVICNEEGLINNMKYCCTLGGNPFFGPVIICGIDDDEFTDVPMYSVRIIETK